MCIRDRFAFVCRRSTLTRRLRNAVGRVQQERLSARGTWQIIQFPAVFWWIGWCSGHLPPDADSRLYSPVVVHPGRLRAVKELEGPFEENGAVTNLSLRGLAPE